VAPDLEEDLAHQLLGDRLVVEEPRQEAENLGVVPPEQELERIALALRDKAQQHRVGRRRPRGRGKIVAHGNTPFVSP
jgi:hypothetical protein